MKIIGLTGGIATGKSTVSNMLEKKGFKIIDADLLVRELQVPGSLLLAEMVDVFGSTILNANGNLNRAKLAQLIFNNPEERAKLDALVHPAVRAMLIKKLVRTTAKKIIVDVPLLFEAGFDDIMSKIIVVSTSPEVQIQRLQKRDSLTEQEAKARINAQMPLAEKIARADYVINNDGSIEALTKQIKDLLKQIG